MKLTKYLLIATFVSLSLFGCKETEYKGEPHLIITLSDAPSVKFVSLVTSVKRVGLYDGSAWQYKDLTIPEFDIMSFTGDYYLTIFDEDVPEGHYSKIRLEFGNENELSVADEETAHAMLSSSDDLVWECDIDLDATADKIRVGSVDLDVDKSVTYVPGTGEYWFSPCDGCRIVDAEAAGAISGSVVDINGNVITSVVQVQFLQNGNILRSTYCSTANGKLFYRLPAGIYDVRFVPQNISFDDMTLDSVDVYDAEATSLGAVVLLKRIE